MVPSPAFHLAAATSDSPRGSKAGAVEKLWKEDWAATKLPVAPGAEAV
jgi:hypothetical protein